MKLSQALAWPVQQFCRLPVARTVVRRLLTVAASAPSNLSDPGEAEFWRRMHRISIQKIGFGGGTRVEGSGERPAVAYLKTLLPESPVLFDVGANIGDYSRMLAAEIPNATIHAFEPSAHTFRLLRQNTAHLPQVRTNNVALGSQSTTATLFSNADGSGLASLFDRRLDHRKSNVKLHQTEQVRVTTLTEFCAAAGIDRIDFLKLDVEGNEMEVLKGAASLLEQGRIGALQFEFGGTNIDSRTYLQDFYYLLAGDFELFRIVEGGLLRLDKYREEDEVFLTANYVAIRRATACVPTGNAVIRTAA